MLLPRRLPGIIYVYRYTVYSILGALSILIYFLFKWNLFCTNLQAWQHVSKMCQLYNDKLAVGSLCAPMCTTKDIHSLTCHSFPTSKEAVFSAKWQNTRLVFKTSSNNNELTQGIYRLKNGVRKYPTENEFTSIIRLLVKSKLNVTLPYNAALRLSRLKPSFEEKNLIQRQIEMDNLWILIQDNEYLLSNIYNDKDVFPQLLGTCGSYFAVEYLEPIKYVSSVLTTSDSKEEWGRRLKIALQILELLDELDEGFREPVHLCDIKLEHFGLVKTNHKLKFIDLDGVYPRSIVNSMIGDVRNKCEKDDDCDFYDCRSRCLTENNKCSNFVRNNNLQIVCEKVFLGWRLSNTVIVPGLLLSQHTPSELASLLRQCANPENESGKPRSSPENDFKTRLINILSEIEQTVNSDVLL